MNRLLRGFTFLEIIIVLAIFSVLLSLALAMGIDSYHGFVRRSERDAVVSLLEHARSHALANLYQTDWGVCYDDNSKNYVTFRGTAYNAGAATNETVFASPGVELSGFPLCASGGGIVFEALSGDLLPQLAPATAEISIGITQNGQTSVVTINNEGRIDG